MPTTNQLAQTNTEIFQAWQRYLTPACHSALSVHEILERIDLKPDSLLAADTDARIRQTAYCFTRLPDSIVFAGNTKWLNMALESDFVSCLFATPQTIEAATRPITKTTIVTEQASEWFHRLHNQAIHLECYDAGSDEAVISPSAEVDSTAVLKGPVFLDDHVSVGPLTVITGPAYIGPGTRIEEHCTIGSRGLFAKKIAGRLEAFSFYGGVVVGSHSHIHARANIAASPHFQNFTKLGEQVSLGISANVGHDAILHDQCTVASTACVCGRGVVGEQAWVGAGAIISDGTQVGPNSKIRIGSVVVQDVEAGADVSGNFAISHHKHLREFMKRK